MIYTYSIKEVSQATGLPETTLRYYEQIDIIPPIRRDKQHKNRCYSEADVQFIESLAQLLDAGMSLSDLREYVINRDTGAPKAPEQIALFRRQEQRLLDEIQARKLRLEYVRLRIAYWQAVDAGDTERVKALAYEARGLIRATRCG